MFFLLFFGWNHMVMAQLHVLNILFENYYELDDLPKSNKRITFHIPGAFVEKKDSIFVKKTTQQSLVSLAPVSDSLISECISYTMLSFNYEQVFMNIAEGSEIWYGISKGSVETYAGIYYKNFPDSARLFVMTTFPLRKKSKTDISGLICERVKAILNKHKHQQIIQ
jgi:hypothetical protein